MGRHRGSAEAKLIRAAMAILPRAGISGLKVRHVVVRAGVPLGAFHYYFHSRKEFCRRILTEFYEGKIDRFDAAVGSRTAGSPLVRLRHMLRAMALFARDNRGMGFNMLRDIMNGDPDVADFMKWHVPQHMRRAAAIIVECQKAGLIRRMPVPVAMSMLAATVMAAPMEVAIAERFGGGHPLGMAARSVLLSDRQLEERIDMVLRAFAPAKGRS